MKTYGLIFFLLISALLTSCAQTAITRTSTQSTSLSSPTLTPTLIATLTSPPQPTTEPVRPTAAQTTSPETPTSAPQPTATPTTNSSTQAQQDCTNTAGYFGDVTIPDGTSFNQDTPFVKTWRIRNEGTCTWGQGYSLVFSSGDVMNGPLTSPLQAAKPGDIIDVSVNLKSPSSGGEFTGFWEFQDASGKRFGVNSNGIDKIWVNVGVSVYSPEGTLVAVGSTPVPAPTQQASSAIPVTGTLGNCTYKLDADYIQQVLQLINDARAKQGLPALKLQDQLSAAALAHSADMACNNYVDHTGSDGSTWQTRVRAQNYKYKYVSENIYVGDPAFGGTPQGAFDWWMNSQIHRDNILSTKISDIGIAYVYHSGSQYGGYYTLDFAHP